MRYALRAICGLAGIIAAGGAAATQPSTPNLPEFKNAVTCRTEADAYLLMAAYKKGLPRGNLLLEQLSGRCRRETFRAKPVHQGKVEPLPYVSGVTIFILTLQKKDAEGPVYVIMTSYPRLAHNPALMRGFLIKRPAIKRAVCGR